MLWPVVAIYLLWHAPGRSVNIAYLAITLIIFIDGLAALFGFHGIFLGYTMSYAMAAICLPAMYATLRLIK